jgi:hypothetical protein
MTRLLDRESPLPLFVPGFEELPVFIKRTGVVNGEDWMPGYGKNDAVCGKAVTWQQHEQL